MSRLFDKRQKNAGPDHLVRAGIFFVIWYKMLVFYQHFRQGPKKMLNLAISQFQHLFKVATHEIVLSWMHG